MTEQNNIPRLNQPKNNTPFHYIDRGYLQYLRFFDTSVPYSNYTDDMRAEKFYYGPVNINKTDFYIPVSHQEKREQHFIIYEQDGRLRYDNKVGMSITISKQHKGNVDCRYMIPCNDSRFIKDCPIKTTAQLNAANGLTKRSTLITYAKNMYDIEHDADGKYRNVGNPINIDKAEKHEKDYVVKKH